MWSDDDFVRALKAHFGHEAFRPGQLPVIRALLSEQPTLAVMPTGAGKSLCYQLPAMLLRDLTIVVSPLLSLMKDQVDRLRQKGLAACALHSALSESEKERVERELAEGRHRLLFVAPERFRSASFRRVLQGVPVSLLAVDEAHCVSEWGHAFRPDYERLGDTIVELKPRRLLALTATATPDVRADIIRALRMQKPFVQVAGFDRPNIYLEVHALASEAERRDSLLAAVREYTPSIVYSATRRQAEFLARHLQQHGVRAGCYHAGLSPDVRERTQEEFANGALGTVVATNAFGLGIDKADVRLVLHSEMPRSMEAYYQELGRAGRDGQPALAALLFCPIDRFVQSRIVALASPAPDLVTLLFERMQQAGTPLTRDAIARALPRKCPLSELSTALAYLDSRGLVEKSYAASVVRLQISKRAPLDGESATAALGRLLGGREGRYEEDEAVRALGLKGRGELDGLLRGLEQQGLVRRKPGEPQVLYRIASGAALTGEHLRSVRERGRREHARLRQMIALATGRRCRRQQLLRALGEQGTDVACSGCDVCSGHRLTPVRSRRPQTARSESNPRSLPADSWTLSPPPGTVPTSQATARNDANGASGRH